MADDNRPASIETKDDVIVVTDSASDRYQTFGFISWWKQDVVRKATALVIGAGALGNEVLKNLALMGIGRVIIVDFDTIEDANLSRSILFRTGDKGRKKAESAAAAVKQINPDVGVKWLHVDINWQLGLGLYRRADVVIGCLDNREARLAINRACWQVGKPWIDGAIGDLLGEARVFWGGHGACYECMLNETDWMLISMRTSCPGLARANIQQGKIPTTPTISSIIGGVQAQEAMKLLNQMDVRPGAGFVFSGYENNSYVIEYSIKQECKDICQYNEQIHPIIEWKEGSASRTTAQEILEFAATQWGPGGYLELDREFVVALQGADPADRIEVLRPFGEMTEEDAVDPLTGMLRRPEFAHRINGDEKFSAWPLAKLGVPPLHILQVRRGQEYIYIELSGDADNLLQFS